MFAHMEPRKALVVLDLQKEFLDPRTGRCLLPEVSSSSPEQPQFLKKIGGFAQRFREQNGDIIWVRSESKARRDFQDPRVEETIIIINSESDSGEDTSGDDAPPPPKRIGRMPSIKTKTGKVDVNGKGPSRPPLLTDAYLSIETRFPPVAPQTPASEWHEPARDMILHSAGDWELVKSWYSAFKDTSLLQRLRGRFVTELYLCGLMTNVSVLATAADAARHGLQVFVLTDCLGYRSEIAHEQALDTMLEQLDVEHIFSTTLIEEWDKKKAKGKGKGSRIPGFGDTGVSNEDLAKMVEGLMLTAQPVDPPPQPAKEKPKPPASKRTPLKGKELAKRVEQIVAAQSEGSDSSEETSSPGVSVKKLNPSRKASVKGKEKSKPAGLTATPARIQAKGPSKEEERAEEASAEGAGKESEDSGTNPVEEILNAAQMKAPETEKKANTLVKGENPQQKQARTRARKAAKKFESKATVLGEDDRVGEGDSYLVKELLAEDLESHVFETLKKEVQWRSMFHRGGEVPRLVAVQGEIDDDGSFPIYRHPADESPPLFAFTPTVERIRRQVEREVNHPINHVLIQHYRHGNDYISEHSDKTLDIARDSKIVNVSVGAQRTMVLRTKKDAIATVERPNTAASTENDGEGKRAVQRIHLPHNSMFVLGLDTNAKWLHAINRDRRDPNIKSADELVYNSERISLTFRNIVTYLSADESTIYGQGATKKSKSDPAKVIKGNSDAAEQMLKAFGAENQRSTFDWDAEYGTGFDVVHIKEPVAKLLSQTDSTEGEEIEYRRVKLCLAEKQILFAEEKLDHTQKSSLHALNPRMKTPVFVDTDRDRTILSDSLGILNYLEMFYPAPTEEGPWLLPAPHEQRSAYGRTCQRALETNFILEAFKRGNKEEVEKECIVWEMHFSKSKGYADGEPEVSLADLALYPVVREVKNRGWAGGGNRWKHLDAWVAKMEERGSVKTVYEMALEAEH